MAYRINSVTAMTLGDFQCNYNYCISVYST